MDDFASAVMMRLVALGLARQGIAPPARPPAGARVPQAAKREALEAVAAAHGPIAVLRIADALPEMPPHPVAEALLRSRDLADLLLRWRRLERFSHARHEILAEPIGGGAVRLVHRARDGGRAPALAETLLVVAVLAALAERIAGRPACLGPGGGPPWRADGRWSEAAVPAPGPVVLALAGPPVGAAPPPAPPAGDVVAALRAEIATDLLRRWRLEECAAARGLSPRGLQRRLLSAGTSFSGLVGEARLAAAAALLCRRDGPGLAEIGFLAGYADQPHFTRAFTAAVGTTPRLYRADFADAG